MKRKRTTRRTRYDPDENLDEQMQDADFEDAEEDFYEYDSEEESEARAFCCDGCECEDDYDQIERDLDDRIRIKKNESRPQR